MVELMLAVLILAIGLIFILQGLSSGLSILNRAQNKYFAACIASEKLQDLEEKAIIS